MLQSSKTKERLRDFEEKMEIREETCLTERIEKEKQMYENRTSKEVVQE